MNKYIREGHDSFYKNKGRYLNPYRLGSSQSNEFERGWSQALKRSPDQLLKANAPRKKSVKRNILLPTTHQPTREKQARSEHIYLMLVQRAKEKLLKSAAYQPPNFQWPNKVYYIRVETYPSPLWKIGVTCNDINSRYCIADRKIIAKIRTWQYATRQEAEACEREVIAEFADYLYKGDPVLRSGGDGELFTRDILELDSRD